MTPQAHKFLMQRLTNMRWDQLPPPKDPKEIRALRKKLFQYDRRMQGLMRDREHRRREALERAREVVFAGDYEAALAAIKQFEQMSF